MKRSTFPWAILIIEVVAYAGWHVLGLILATLGLGGAYLASLWLHPRIRHGRCRGTGEVRGSVFTWTFRKCPGCNGGRLIRWGAGQWGAEHVRNERRATAAARARARAEHRWR